MLASSTEASVKDPGQRRAQLYLALQENNLVSDVRAGENKGRTLKHDFVVRQYVTLGNFDGPQVLKLAAIHAQPDHPRQINVVVSDTQNGEILQAISLQCPP